MRLDDIRATPGHLIRRAQQITSSFFSEAVDGADLTSVQFASLAVIREHAGIDATGLCGLVAFDRATMGGVLERLETKKLIVRKGSETDKRIKRLYLTNAGTELLEVLEPAVRSVQERLLSAFDDTERDVFLRLLRKLVEAHNPSLPASVRAEGVPYRAREKRATRF